MPIQLVYYQSSRESGYGTERNVLYLSICHGSLIIMFFFGSISFMCILEKSKFELILIIHGVQSLPSVSHLLITWCIHYCVLLSNFSAKLVGYLNIKNQKLRVRPIYTRFVTIENTALTSST